MTGSRCEHSGWIRVSRNGPGIRWTKAPPLFSERYGYERPFLRIGKWRVFWLPRWRDLEERLADLPSRWT